MRTRTAVVAALVVALALTACSGPDYTAQVELEARWQCDVQRQTLDRLADVDAELAGRLADAGITPEEYAAFQEALTNSASLRADVARRYEEYCLAGAPAE